MIEYWYIWLIVAVAVPLIYTLFKPRIMGLTGERDVALLLARLPKSSYTTMHNIKIRSRNRSAQIDHLIVSSYGVFVIETKNYSGWIFGGEHGQHWTQVIYHWKKRFYNPIRQNQGHVRALEYHLQDYPNIRYIPIVVFSTRATLKIRTYSDVAYTTELLHTIKKYDDVMLTDTEKQEIVNRIKAISKKRNSKFRRRVPETCPRCKGELIARMGKYGRFTGCSNFPACKYTRNELN